MVLLSIFTGFTAVTIYSSYNYVLRFIGDSSSKMFASVSASFGNLFAMEKINKKPFYEMLAFFIFGLLLLQLLHLTSG